jgi:hypothetical protein
LYLLKNYFLSVGAFDISTESFLSLLSFHPKLSLSPSHFPLCSLCSLFSLCSFGGWFFGGWACRRGLGSSVVGLAAVPDPCRSGGHPSVPISAWTRETHPTAKLAAWGCRARSLPVWRSPIRADLGLASPSSPNEFELAKKGSPKVELGLEVVEPCRLVAEKILVAEINLK